jgi:predicted metal-dependent peptidase
MKDKQESRIKRAHIMLMKHQQTALYSGVMLMGNTEVVDGSFSAYTDGVNKKYCRQFVENIKEDSKLRGLVLHENLHVALKQLPRGRDMWKEDAKLANVAADLVVNDIIVNITGCVDKTTERIVELPDGGLHDAKYSNWSMREIYEDLKKQNPQRKKPKPQDGGTPCPKGSGQGDGDSKPQGGEPQNGQDDDKINVNGKQYDLSDPRLDEHDMAGTQELSADEIKELDGKIDRALREGGILAGRVGGNIPRSISDLLQPQIDWREELAQFVTSATKGSDEFTWRKMNKRQMANDIYMPSVENEAVGEVVVAIDTSGSIGSEEITEFATELVAICNACSPEQVRVLWWDTKVHGEQMFTEKDYGNLAGLLKPLGGGGTHVSSVSEYIVKNGIRAECVLVFTDGYVESNIKWGITSPTLWMITHNRGFTPPVGKSVMFNRD